MPLYTYQVINDDGTDGEIVQLMHGMDEPDYDVHPETGQRLTRVYAAPHIAGSSHERQVKQNTSDENLDRLGFTKYVRNGKGHYEKHVGRGPDNLSAD